MHHVHIVGFLPGAHLVKLTNWWLIIVECIVSVGYTVCMTERNFLFFIELVSFFSEIMSLPCLGEVCDCCLFISHPGANTLAWCSTYLIISIH